MRISPLDSPRSQFLGPITAVTLLHKHLAVLGAHFADANAITSNIFEVLFDGSRAASRRYVLDAVRAVNPQDAAILEDAFNISAGLSRADKMRSIDFINGIIQVDVDLIAAIAAEFRHNPVSAEFDASISVYLGQIIASDEIRGMTPVTRPVAASLIRIGLFASEDELNDFARNYSDYAPMYAYAPDDIILRDYIDRKLQGTGIMGWLYRPNQRFSDVQLNNIANHVRAEIPATRTAALAAIGWPGFATGTHRTLDFQIQASMSECSKSDKSLKAKLM